uniref:Uncharacterized protein n=1 Tax=Anopheles coluzzii TaxID=1518534 RepID=A0A8W7P7P1_ANOCL
MERSEEVGFSDAPIRVPPVVVSPRKLCAFFSELADVRPLMMVLVPSLTFDISGMEPLKLIGRISVAGRSGMTGFSRITTPPTPPPAVDPPIPAPVSPPSSLLLFPFDALLADLADEPRIVVLGRATGFSGGKTEDDDDAAAARCITIGSIWLLVLVLLLLLLLLDAVCYTGLDFAQHLTVHADGGRPRRRDLIGRLQLQQVVVALGPQHRLPVVLGLRLFVRVML